MSSLRKRRWIGTLLAAVFALTAIMPGAVAAAQGVQFQAHICSPDGEHMPDRGPLAHAEHEHCQLCPATFSYVPVAGSDRAGLYPVRTAVAAEFTASTIHPVRRIELSPLNERGPPLQV